VSAVVESALEGLNTAVLIALDPASAGFKTALFQGWSLFLLGSRQRCRRGDEACIGGAQYSEVGVCGDSRVCGSSGGGGGARFGRSHEGGISGGGVPSALGDAKGSGSALYD